MAGLLAIPLIAMMGLAIDLAVSGWSGRACKCRSMPLFWWWRAIWRQAATRPMGLASSGQISVGHRVRQHGRISWRHRDDTDRQQSGAGRSYQAACRLTGTANDHAGTAWRHGHWPSDGGRRVHRAKCRLWAGAWRWCSITPGRWRAAPIQSVVTASNQTAEHPVWRLIRSRISGCRSCRFPPRSISGTTHTGWLVGR